MNLRIFGILLCLIIAPSLIFSQERQLKKGDENYDNLAYAVAAKYYIKALEKGYSSPDIYRKIGDAYYYNSDYGQAYNWYYKLFQNDTNIEPEYYFKYAQTLRSQNRHEEASEILEKFQELQPGDSRAQLLKNSPHYLDSIKTQTSLYNVQNLDLNSPESDFAPSLLNEDMVFASARDTGVFKKFTHKWSTKTFLDLYRAPINNLTKQGIKRLSNNINSKFHESTAVFTKDGNTIYFTRNNYVDGKRRRDSKGTTRLKIFKASYEDGDWTNIEELPFNNDEYSVAHPALSPDETKLYFASDMPGSYGMSDIYVVDILPNGGFSQPKNLGPEINTESRESFPYISEYNNMYFASDGHLGLGGLDIFVTEIDDDTYGQVVNLGKPVNSSSDDFTFVINDETKMGYFASNRSGGKGEDDIYVFQIGDDFHIRCQKIITGIVTNFETEEVLKDAVVALMDDGEKIEEIQTDEEGTYSFLVECEEDEKKLLGTKIGFLPKEETVQITGKKSDTIWVNIKLLKELQTPVGGYDLAKLIKLRPIYFDFDKSNIRSDARVELNRIAQVLINNPDLMVDIKSHTDSRGPDSYNMRLSDRRAQSTLEYIKSRGVTALNLTARGYGESRPVNQCRNGVRCSEHDHQLNRRSEFVLANELIYTVQVGAVKNGANLNKFDNIPNIYSYDYDDGLTRVYSGMFTTDSKARAHMEELKLQGNEGFIRKLYIEGSNDPGAQLVNNPRFQSGDIPSYTVQVAALRTHYRPGKFSHIREAYGKTYDDGYTRVYSGDFSTKEEAERRRAELLNRGIPGFVRKIQGSEILQ